MATTLGLIFLILVAGAFALMAFRRFRVRPLPDWLRGEEGDDPPAAGVREPRRPSPRDGAASAAEGDDCA